nr:MAG TPA: hypothetical protein [Caudoviricetes sp.]
MNGTRRTFLVLSSTRTLSLSQTFSVSSRASTAWLLWT